MGAKAEILDDGCCGMAGSFGFEEHKYEVSMKVYEHELAPHLRNLPAEKLVLADGFSCKTQIEHATGQRPLHLAQLLHMAKRGGPVVDDRGAGFQDGIVSRNSSLLRGALLLGGIALGAWYLLRRIQQ
jgi:hypothetical protein